MIRIACRYLCLLVMVNISLCAQAQNVVYSDSIIIEPTFNGNDFIYHGKKLGPAKVLQLMDVDEPAYDIMAKAHESYVFGNLFCIIGSALLVYPIASSFIDKDPNWVIAASGGGLILISVPIFINYNRQSTEAIQLYNSQLVMGSKAVTGASASFGLTPDGIGLTVHF